jgi:hypothetical protein
VILETVILETVILEAVILEAVNRETGNRNRMGAKRMLDPKLMAAIDVCRPGSRDLEQPELADLAASLASDPEVRAVYDQVQRSDQRLTAAMHEVPIPAGLANRILDRHSAAPASCGGAAAMAVNAAVSREPATITPASAQDSKLPASIAPESGRRLIRRRLAVGLGLAACLLVIAGLVVLDRQPDSSPVAVTEKAAGWYEQLSGGWQPMAKAPQGFALPKGIGGGLGGWQWVAKTVAKSGLVFDLGQAQPGPVGRSGAVLFVIKSTRSDLPSSAPRTPQSTTAGLAIGVWQSGGLMYVLVVRGNEHDYQKLLHPAPPLA